METRIIMIPNDFPSFVGSPCDFHQDLHLPVVQVPAAELYLGLTSYSTAYRVRGFDVSRDPAVLQRVCTLQEIRQLGVFKEKVVTCTAQWDESKSEVCISCANLAGEHLAKFQALQAIWTSKWG